ncbi:MAG: response regulator [Candidatus Pacebacteria bacterium]|nr:response regulator [Candidatus Paceibacterota bacterium]
MNNNKKKILVIEDEATLQKALSDILIREGYDVINATDGTLGLSLARSENPDLILLDIILPGMDGFEILRNIKEKDKSQVPIIILTNLSDLNDIQKALDIGATTYLVKADFHLDDVLKKVKDVLIK